MADDLAMRHQEVPGHGTLARLIGKSMGRWDALVTRLTHDMGAQATWAWGGTKSGWELRFKRGGRPLTTLSPRRDGFVALVVLGREEAARAADLELGARARRTLEVAHAYHDGRWLFLTVEDDVDLDDITALIVAKLPTRLREALRPTAPVARSGSSPSAPVKPAAGDAGP